MPTILVGLGNPGEEYAHTYHNVGFLALDDMAIHHGATGASAWHQAPGKSFVFLKLDPLVLVKPTTFMNDSGKAVREALKFFGSDREHLVILHDDSDLPIGTYKYEGGRGSAGHHGIESVVDALRSQEFLRVRIGIRPPTPEGTKRKKASDFVLAHISAPHLNTLHSLFGEVAVKLIENE